MKYDLLLKNARVIDPRNELNDITDLGIKNGKVKEVGKNLDQKDSWEYFDLTDKYLVPGFCDLHVHISSWLGGRLGHKMLARAGVTTALDLSGPVESVLEYTRDYGAGLNVACINYVRPGHTVQTNDPKKDELKRFLDSTLKKGALGFKLLGGHYPLSPEATQRAIETANEGEPYVAFHAGTLDNPSNIDGFKEALELAEGSSLHLAHINSYCRGQVSPVEQEVKEAIELLDGASGIVSESYLSPVNGTSANCSGGVPESNITKKCLELKGYPVSEQGLEQAIKDGWAKLIIEEGGVNTLAWGEQGVTVWKNNNTDGTVCFPVNPHESRYLLAAARGNNKKFVVDAIGTDGGGIPRNDTARLGLLLVKFGALSLDEFVEKTALNPTQILGLENKGHLAPGADADITVLDPVKERAHMTVSSGKVVMYQGLVTGSGGTFITTKRGVEAPKKYGLAVTEVDLTASRFYQSN